MKKSLLFLILGLIVACANEGTHVIPGTGSSLPSPTLMDDAQQKIVQFKQQMLEKGVLSSTDWESFISQVVYREDLIKTMDKPSTSKPWYVYKKISVTDPMVQGGISFYKENEQVLKQVAKKTGVGAEYIVAILGIETRYGAFMGQDRVADVLYTLSFYYPRREALFQKELEQFFLMSKEAGRDLFSYKGSFAGAMGYPQFMPSSYRKWAVSYSKQEPADIWENKADAVASVANYLQLHGWVKGQKVVYPVSLEITPELQTLIDEKTSLSHTVKELKEKGVNISVPLSDEEPVILFRLERAPGEYDYYVGLKNFYSIWDYNHSRHYVMAVEGIAEGIRQGIGK
ncbi:MAG: lytic murein transglycosylase B [Neisseriaceae bacterium]